MRISSKQIHQVAVNAMLDQESKLSKVQKQVATGERISSSSDDPVAAARIVDIQQSIDNFDQFQTTIESSRARLEIQEGILENVVSSIQRVRELTIQANNAIQTNETRNSIGVEIAQLTTEIKGLANSVDSNNDYLFAGTKVHSKPFTETERGNFKYNGDDGRRMLQIGPGRQVASGDSGTEVFRAIRNGNGKFSINQNQFNRGTAVSSPGNATRNYIPGDYVLEFREAGKSGVMSYQVTDDKGTIILAPGNKYREDALIEFNGIQTSFKGSPQDGDKYLFTPSKKQDVFSTFRHLERALRTPRHGSDAKTDLSNTISQSIVSLDKALENILTVRSKTGSRLHALDNQQEINTNHLLHLKQLQSEIKDLDYTEAVTRLNQRLTGLEASQKAYSRVQNLTMFDYI